MAPVPDSVYFPELAKCLDSEQLLISWREAFVALDGRPGSDHDKFESLLLAEPVQAILSCPFDPFPAPSSQSKSEFEVRSAPINVTDGDSKPYKLSEVKEDAVWLSNEVKIDEVSALRIVVLEFQTRSRKQLLCSFSPEEEASLRDVSGRANTETSNLIPHTLLVSTTTAHLEQAEFNSAPRRHHRLLQLYLSERCHILRCVHLILQARSTSEQVENGKRQQDDGDVRALVRQTLLSKLTENDGRFNGFLQACTKALDKKGNALLAGSGWLKGDDSEEAIQAEWLSGQITEMILIMEVMLWVLETDRSGKPRHEVFPIRPSVVVLGWFKFGASFGFFDKFITEFPAITVLIGSMQALVAAISLSLVDPWSSVSLFDERAPPEQAEHDKPYLTDLDAVSELNQIMFDAALSQSSVASPAVFGWSIVLGEVRSTFSNRKEARELRQSQRAIDGFEAELQGELDNEFPGALNQPPRRRNSVSSELSLEKGLHDKIMEIVMDTPDGENFIEGLARSAIDGCNVFDILTALATSGSALSPETNRQIRLIVLDSIRCSFPLLGYIPEVATSVLAALFGDTNFWDLEERAPLVDEEDPVAVFCLDDVLREFFFGSALSRYPYESLPFLRMSRAIACCQSLAGESGGPVLLTWLSTLHSFTYQLPENFRNYETAQEEENTNTIRLTRPVPLFAPRLNKNVYFGTKDLVGNDDLVVPAGTIGRIISDSGPKVAVWFHEMSGLKYLGKLLETALASGDYVDATTNDVVDRECLTEIVGIMATLLLTSNRLERAESSKLDPQGPTHRILEEASDGLSRNRDVVSVIFSIFEEELQLQSQGSEHPLNLLVSCTQFIYALVPVLPGRVWPLLGRSGLLDINGPGGKLTAIFGAVELVTSRYDFLISCAHLLDALVEDAVTNAVVRKSRSKTMVRFGSAEDLGTGVPSRVLSNVILSFSRAISEAFISSCNWRYVESIQRLELSTITSSVLNKIIVYTYSVDDTSQTPDKLTASLEPAAAHIIEIFLSKASGYLTFQPFLRALLDGYSTPALLFQSTILESWKINVNSVLRLATTLIRLAGLLEETATQFEAQLFKASPLIVRLYAVHESYQDSVIRLLDALVVCAGTGDAEPPSLLGYLGSQTSKNFLHMLSNLGRPLDNNAHTILIWRLLASVVSNRQQWFAICLLTGQTPRATLEKAGSDSVSLLKTKSLFKMALESLLHIADMTYPRAVAMLEFVSLSQNFWPWAVGELRKDPGFVKAMKSYVAKVEPVPLAAKLDRSIEGCYQAQIAAHIAEILAMDLYHRRQLGKKDEDILDHVAYFTRSAVSVPNYNSSLHGNLSQNFESKFPGCNLQNFKRTRLESREFGRDYYYDMELAQKVLKSDQSWIGTKNDGLGEELITANVNLSLVEAQTAVLHGWKLLATELSSSIRGDVKRQRLLAKVAVDCLISNTRAQLPENVFAQLTQTRADLALILTQRLVDVGSEVPECKAILKHVWEAIRHSDTNFETALSTNDPQAALYYRTLLKLLYLALQPHAGSDSDINLANPKDKEASQKVAEELSQGAARAQIVLEIISKVVFPDIRGISRALHEFPGTAQPDDVALLTAIFQAGLKIPGMDLNHNYLLTLMTASDVARVVTTLFSWSDKLAIDGDPVYGELSIQCLVELSSVPAMAEQLALDGVLGNISSAGIMSFLRGNNVSPFAEGAGPQRCYAIWSRGILPLVLNILDAVGSSIAGEVALFLNQFPNLLANSAAIIDPPSSTSSFKAKTKYLCYATVQEISCLTLISFVLSRFRDSMGGIVEIPEVKWDVGEVRESVEWWIGSRAVLRDRLVPLGAREQAWAKKGPLAQGALSKNRLEEVVMGELEQIRDVLNGGDA